MDEGRTRLHRRIIIALDIPDIDGLLQTISLHHKTDVIPLALLVISITFNIFKILSKIIIVQKCLDIATLAVTYDIQMILFFEFFSVFSNSG